MLVFRGKRKESLSSSSSSNLGDKNDISHQLKKLYLIFIYHLYKRYKNYFLEDISHAVSNISKNCFCVGLMTINHAWKITIFWPVWVLFSFVKQQTIDNKLFKRFGKQNLMKNLSDRLFLNRKKTENVCLLRVVDLKIHDIISTYQLMISDGHFQLKMRLSNYFFFKFSYFLYLSLHKNNLTVYS